MKFEFTPEEAQKTARSVARHLKKLGGRVNAERRLSSDAPYRTTLHSERNGVATLIEAQGTMQYHREIKDLARWLAANRTYSVLYIAISENTDIQVSELRDMKSDGIGLMTCTDDGNVQIIQEARNPALVVTPDPTLKYGHCKKEVLDSVEKFNHVNRKDGLRDMCELVERETEVLALLAARKHKIILSESNIRSKDWAGQIDTLASQNACAAGLLPILDSNIKDDLKSFTRGRNLVKHKVLSKREEDRRQRQFADRMMQGPRLIAELISLQRKIR